MNTVGQDIFADFNKTAKISCLRMRFKCFIYQESILNCQLLGPNPRNGIFGNPRKYHVREHFMSYSK